MPFRPTQPEQAVVPVPTAKTLEVCHITEVRLTLPPDGAPSAQVTWVAGYLDEAKVFVAGETRTVLLHGKAFVDAINGVSDGRETIYQAVRRATWALLVSEGHVPAGAVT